MNNTNTEEKTAGLPGIYIKRVESELESGNYKDAIDIVKDFKWLYPMGENYENAAV